MIEYYMLYLIFAVTAFLGSFSKESGGDMDKVRKYQNLVCFISVVVLLMFRHQSMGIDLQWDGNRESTGYLPFFDRIAELSLKEFLSRTRRFRYETGFKIYMKAVSMISSNRQFFIAVTAFLSLFPIYILFREKSSKPVLSWVIYLGLSPFLLLYSTLRQGLVIGIAALMYIWAEDRKWIRCLIGLFVACSLHVSSVLLILIYPAVNIKLTKNSRLIAVFLLTALPFVKDSFINLIITVFPKYAYAFNREGNAVRFFVVLLATYIICHLATDESRFQNAYMNLFFISCVFQMMGGVSNVAPRAGFYFMNALCILLPDVIDKIRIRENGAMLELGAAVCFSALGLYCIYSTYWAMAYPYYWFWEIVV